MNREHQIFFSNETDHVLELNPLFELGRKVLESELVIPPTETSVIFCDKPTIRTINKEYLEVDEPTDVLSFPIDLSENIEGRYLRNESDRVPDNGGKSPTFEFEQEQMPLLVGDIWICVDVAIENATTYEVSLEDELRLLLVHGYLHLLGYDHEIPSDLALMREKEKNLLDLSTSLLDRVK
jgi:probable rRNA maturation factor